MGMIRKMKYVSSYVVDKMEDVHKRLEGRWQRKLFVLYSHTQKPGFNKQLEHNSSWRKMVLEGDYGCTIEGKNYRQQKSCINKMGSINKKWYKQQNQTLFSWITRKDNWISIAKNKSEMIASYSLEWQKSGLMETPAFIHLLKIIADTL